MNPLVQLFRLFQTNALLFLFLKYLALTLRIIFCDVIGTVFLQGKREDVAGDESSSDRAGPVTKIGKLYYDTSGDVPIVLVPQPSDDPNDPLVSRYPKLGCCKKIVKIATIAELT